MTRDLPLRTLLDLARLTERRESTERTCTDVTELLAELVPFALVYLLDGARAILAARAGEIPTPRVIDLASDARPIWPLQDAMCGPLTVTEIGMRFGEVGSDTATLYPLDRVGVLIVGDGADASFEIASHLAARALAKARGAEDRERARTDLELGIGNRLRAHTRAITAWAQILREQPGRLDHGLRAIERAARSQARVLRGVIDASRVLDGDLRLEHEVVSLGDVIDAALEPLRFAARSKALELTVEVAPGARYVLGDRARVAQAIGHLAHNAVKATPFGGSVSIRARAKEDRVVIEVEDSGPGIDPDFVPFLFARARPRGLGLALVHAIASAHGGDVSVASGEDGAVFTLELPRAEPPLAPEQGSCVFPASHETHEDR